MALSINPFLEKYVLQLQSDPVTAEGKKIENSLGHLRANLGKHFGSDILEVKLFGSFKRDTFLRRKYNENSDIDVMVLFDHEKLKVQPITYRKYLEDFAGSYYRNSISFKSQPAIVLELTHIKIDLVPAYLGEDLFTTNLFIPESNREWMTTSLDEFEIKAHKKDEKNNFLIKPVIRLLKAWNAKAGFPLRSYELEKEVIEDFYVFPQTLEEYFFNAIYYLNSSDISSVDRKIDALKANARRVRKALGEGKEKQAFTWLAHILPLE